MHPSCYFLFTAFLLTGCTTMSSAPSTYNDKREQALNEWVDTELAPYLAEQLSSHPRFRGEPVLLVSMSGADVTPDIDELSESIRDQIHSELLNAQGVHLIWRPTVKPWQHHRSLAKVDCDDNRQVHYFIGIDTKLTPEGDLRVAVRALDVEAQSWVSGFGKQWRGDASSRHTRALARRHTDEYLRGLRVLPFEDAQSDLLAAYLATNLSCLVRQLGTDEILIYPEPLAKSPETLHRTLDLVGNYLARFREVRVTKKRSEANFVLRGEAHDIHDGLYQLWALVESADNGEHLQGADTEAYVKVQPARARPVAATTVVPAPIPSAVPVAPSTPSVVPQPLARKTVLSDLRLMRPRHPRVCGSSRGLPPGSWVPTRYEVLTPNACFAIEFDIEQDAYVFLLKHDSNGGIERMLSNLCNGYGRAFSRGVTLRYPRPRGTRIPYRPSEETFYAIAARDARASRSVADHLARLADPCERWLSRAIHQAEFETWLHDLRRLTVAYPGEIEWRALRVRHIN